MIRPSKFADYGIVLMTSIANSGDEQPSNARVLSESSQLPLPTVSKILKRFSRAGLLVSHRGKQGGYTLAKRPRDITVAEMIAAVDGPIALTACGPEAPGLCDLEPSCPVRSNWQRITAVVHTALEKLTLADMTTPIPACDVSNDNMPQTPQLVELGRR